MLLLLPFLLAEFPLLSVSFGWSFWLLVVVEELLTVLMLSAAAQVLAFLAAGGCNAAAPPQDVSSRGDWLDDSITELEAAVALVATDETELDI